MLVNFRNDIILMMRWIIYSPKSNYVYINSRYYAWSALLVVLYLASLFTLTVFLALRKMDPRYTECPPLHIQYELASNLNWKSRTFFQNSKGEYFLYLRIFFTNITDSQKYSKGEYFLPCIFFHNLQIFKKLLR